VASARFRVEPDHLYVGRVAVLPAYRRRGIASSIMVWMEETALSVGRTRIRVSTRMSLLQNFALYLKLDYTLVDVQPHPKGPDRVGTRVKGLTPGGREPRPLPLGEWK